MSSEGILAIDVGTGSARAIVFDDSGAIVAQTAREWQHLTVPGHAGGTTFDTDAGWDAIVNSIRGAVSRLDKIQIVAIVASSMREGFVLYDGRGQEIWACPNTDGRARREADELVQEGVAEEIYEASGDWVSITAPARIRWIARNQPEVLQQAQHFGMLSDWVTTKLTGEFLTDPSCGSSSALFDLRARNWSQDLAEAVGINSSILPPVVEAGTRAGSLTSEAAAETGLPVGIPVMVGGADTQLALHGIAARPGTPTIVAGTFWQTTALTSSPLVDPDRRLRTLCHVEPNSWMIEGIGYLSGLAMRWFRDAMCSDAIQIATERGISPFTVMEDWAAETPPGANGVIAALSNVMQADAWHHAPPTFTGFDINDPVASSRGAFIRAIEEAAAIVAAAHLEILDELTLGASLESGQVTFTGGSSSGELWPKIIAGITGLETQVTPAPEATAYGAARIAAREIGLSLPPMSSPRRTVRPSEEEKRAYDPVVRRWHRVYRNLASMSGGDLPPLFTPPGAATESSDINHRRRDEREINEYAQQ